MSTIPSNLPNEALSGAARSMVKLDGAQKFLGRLISERGRNNLQVSSACVTRIIEELEESKNLIGKLVVDNGVWQQKYQRLELRIQKLENQSASVAVVSTVAHRSAFNGVRRAADQEQKISSQSRGGRSRNQNETSEEFRSFEKGVVRDVQEQSTSACAMQPRVQPPLAARERCPSFMGGGGVVYVGPPEMPIKSSAGRTKTHFGTHFGAHAASKLKVKTPRWGFEE